MFFLRAHSRSSVQHSRYTIDSHCRVATLRIHDVTATPLAIANAIAACSIDHTLAIHMLHGKVLDSTLAGMPKAAVSLDLEALLLVPEHGAEQPRARRIIMSVSLLMSSASDRPTMGANRTWLAEKAVKHELAAVDSGG